MTLYENQMREKIGYQKRERPLEQTSVNLINAISWLHIKRPHFNHMLNI